MEQRTLTLHPDEDASKKRKGMTTRNLRGNMKENARNIILKWGVNQNVRVRTLL